MKFTNKHIVNLLSKVIFFFFLSFDSGKLSKLNKTISSIKISNPFSYKQVISKFTYSYDSELGYMYAVNVFGIQFLVQNTDSKKSIYIQSLAKLYDSIYDSIYETDLLS